MYIRIKGLCMYAPQQGALCRNGSRRLLTPLRWMTRLVHTYCTVAQIPRHRVKQDRHHNIPSARYSPLRASGLQA